MKQSKMLSVLTDYLIVTFGTLLYCIGWTSFLIPGGIASGGGTGLCTIVYFATGIPVAYSFIVLNIVLLSIGFLVLGKGFGFKTIYVIILSTVLFYVLDPNNFEVARKLVVSFDDRLITAIVGGLIEAIGISIVLMRGGSTGGTDILAMVVSKYWPVSPGRVYLYADLFIIASVLLLPDKTVNDMVYGYVVMVTFSVTVDSMLMGSKSSVQLLVFSSKYREIADYIRDHKKRGVTALDSVGWYTGQEGKVLLIICYKIQMQDFINTIKEIDPKAFVSVSSTNSVYGEGFEEVKTGIKKKTKSKLSVENAENAKKS
jgi:yitT family protein